MENSGITLYVPMWNIMQCIEHTHAQELAVNLQVDFDNYNSSTEKD